MVGVDTAGGGTRTVVTRVVGNNRASETDGTGNASVGRGIDNNGGRGTLTNSTVCDNNAGADYGAAIRFGRERGGR